MAIYKEQLVYRTKGPLAQREDWYRLCYDTGTAEFFVEHEWDYVNPYKLGSGDSSSGTTRHSADEWTGEGSDRIEATKQILLERAQT